MCVGTSGKDETWVWLVGCFTHLKQQCFAGALNMQTSACTALLTPWVSLGREHYRRLASTVRRCRHLTTEKISLHAHEDKKNCTSKIITLKKKKRRDKQDISKGTKNNQVNPSVVVWYMTETWRQSCSCFAARSLCMMWLNWNAGPDIQSQLLTQTDKDFTVSLQLQCETILVPTI